MGFEQGPVRLSLDQRQLQLLRSSVREALAAGLVRSSDVAGVCELLELVEAKLPDTADRIGTGGTAGRLVLEEEILRILASAEDSGRSSLSVLEIDEQLQDKPAGTSIRRTVEALRRSRLIQRVRGGAELALTRDGRVRARREPVRPSGEHAIQDAEQLLDLVMRAAQDRVWHVPTVQGVSGVDARRFATLEGALEADGLIGDAAGSYRTITRAGTDRALARFREHRLPGTYWPQRLLPPVRRPGELLRRREDLACPNCGHQAAWLKSRKGGRYEQLREIGIAEHRCTYCDVRWTVYTEPVDSNGRYDPFADPTVCRPRWAYRGGLLHGDRIAPAEHWSDR